MLTPEQEDAARTRFMRLVNIMRIAWQIEVCHSRKRQAPHENPRWLSNREELMTAIANFKEQHDVCITSRDDQMQGHMNSYSELHVPKPQPKRRKEFSQAADVNRNSFRWMQKFFEELRSKAWNRNRNKLLQFKYISESAVAEIRKDETTDEDFDEDVDEVA